MSTARGAPRRDARGPSRAAHLPCARPEPRGFTLVELVIVVAIVGILASAALPLARWGVKRGKEHELHQALRVLRTAIDRYHDAARAGLIEIPEGASGYPPSLQTLVEGVPLIAEMPSPTPPVADEYAASGPGLTGGLEALRQAEQQASGGLGPAGPRPGADADDPLERAGPGRQAGPRAGLQEGLRARLQRQQPEAARARPAFGARLGVAGERSAAGLDAPAPAEPILGPDGQPVKLVFLRRLPVDPFTGEADWGLRCYGEPPADRLWCGRDVFDVYSRSPARAIDGSNYRDW